MAAWPDYAAIGGDYTARLAPQTERAAFDDGAVRQARTTTRPVLLREVVAHVPGARFEAFRSWARAHARDWFAWADPGAGGAVHSARSSAARTASPTPRRRAAARPPGKRA